MIGLRSDYKVSKGFRCQTSQVNSAMTPHFHFLWVVLILMSVAISSKCVNFKKQRLLSVEFCSCLLTFRPTCSLSDPIQAVESSYLRPTEQHPSFNCKSTTQVLVCLFYETCFKDYFFHPISFFSALEEQRVEPQNGEFRGEVGFDGSDHKWHCAVKWTE